MTDARNSNGDKPEDHPDALALAEAEAEEAEAVAAAARARARAVRLRRQADDETGPAPDAEPGATPETDETPPETDETAPETDETPPAPKRWSPRRLRPRRLPRPAAIMAGTAVVAIVALLATSGFFLWQHRGVSDRERRVDEFTAAARSCVVTLMSLDFNHAKEDVQRVIDSSTGDFKSQFQKNADALVKMLQEIKVSTETTIKAAALEEMTDDNSAVVLVAATTRASNSLSAQQPPRKWRLSVTVTRDGGQLKMSKLDFGL